MKILFIYKYLTLGGVETVLRTRIDFLIDLGWEPYLWFLQDFGGSGIFQGLEGIIHIGHTWVDKTHRLDSFDKIISIDTEEIIPQLVREASDVEILFEAHSPYFENLEYLRSERFNSLHVSKIIVPSRHQLQVVSAFGVHENKIVVVPNPVAEYFFSPINDRVSFRRPILLWVGRLDELKNWEFYLQVLADLRGEIEECHGFMVGDFPGKPIEGKKLLNEFKKRGILSNVRWIPRLSHKLMPALFDMVRESGGLVISTSRNESFGMVIAEGMARGCTVVAPNRGPFPEFVISGVNGCLYTPGDDIPDLANLVLDLLRDQESRSRLGQAAFQAASNQFHAVCTIPTLYNILAGS